MNKPITNSQTKFGFISVREIEGIGHCGGLLIVSQIGRPIEFHCSAPVAPNRAQQILYGQTYQTFLYCEQIGLALIDKAKSKPQLFIANCAPLLGLSSMIEEPVVVLGDEVSANYFSDSGAAAMGSSQPISFECNQQTLWSAPDTETNQRNLISQKLLSSFTKSLTLDEPFERIQKAIEEAQAVAK